MRTKLISLVIFLVGAVVPTAPSSAAEGFDTVVPLPSRLAYGVSYLVDSQHVYVPLVAQSILVLDHQGNTVTTIDIGANLKSVSLSPDHSKLWVVSHAGATVTAYDTTTFEEVDQVSLNGYCPDTTVQTGSYLVSVNTCAYTGEPNLTIVDLDGDRTPFQSDAAVPEAYWLGVSPTNPDLIIGFQVNPVIRFWVAEIAGKTVELVSSMDVPANYPVVDPVAANLVAAVFDSPNPTRFPVYALPALDEVDSYPVPGAAPYASGVTFSNDGAWLATVTHGDGFVAYSLFERGGAAPVWQYSIDGVTNMGGGRLNEDGSVLFAVTEDNYTYDLHIIDVDLVNPPTPLPIVPGSISGSIIDPDGRTVDMGHVDVLDDAKSYLFTEDATASGSYTITDLDPGTYYLVMWNGDDQTIWDYFPQWYAGAPLYRSDLATPVHIAEAQEATGVNTTLPWLYDDMFGNVFQADIFWLGNSGITKGCNPPDNYLFCPDEYVTRGQMAAFINRGFDLDEGDVEFVDDDGSIFEADIERLAAAGITKGCNPPVNDRFCPDALVTRGQMAAFMTRTFVLVDRGDSDFVDDDGSVFEADIERLAAAGITKGCNPPVNDRFCPDSYVTRGQMAAFFHRGYENVIFAAAGADSTARASQLPDRDVLTSR